MVCKTINIRSRNYPAAASPAKRSSSTNRAAKKVLQKATKSAISRDRKRKMVTREFESLRNLIPTLSSSSDPLAVVLEAIGYIQRLEKQVLLGGGGGATFPRN
jgi:hypothetical protein